MSSIDLTGMVLSATNIGEADKKLTILTKEKGRITAFVNGARRAKSTLAAASNPFCFGTFTCLEQRSSYKVIKVDISEYFTELSQDYDRVCLGSYFLEVADYCAVENVSEKERLLLLYLTIKELLKDRLPVELIRAIYELKSWAIGGVYPNVFSCVNCGQKEELTHFAMGLRGCLCKNCAPRLGGNPLNSSVHYALKYVIATPVEKLYTFSLSREVMEEFVRLIDVYRLNYENHHYKALDFLQ